VSEKKPARLDPALTKALGHELRVDILERLQGRVASPTQLAKETGATIGLVTYHVNVLIECGCLEPVRTRQRRGATEHFYRAKPGAFIGSPVWRKVPRSVLGGVSSPTLQAFFDQATAALEAGTLDGPKDAVLTCASITVDQVGWAQAGEILNAAFEQLRAVHDQSQQRLALSGGDGSQMIVGLTGFEAAPPPEDQSQAPPGA
jgi:DNA-binding transcriptional ArsR family regulator